MRLQNVWKLQEMNRRKANREMESTRVMAAEIFLEDQERFRKIIAVAC